MKSLLVWIFSTRNTVTIQKSKLCFVFLSLFVWKYVQPSAVEKILLYSHRSWSKAVVKVCNMSVLKAIVWLLPVTTSNLYKLGVEKVLGFVSSILYILWFVICCSHIDVGHEWSKCCLCQSSCDLHWLQVILYQKQIGCTWHCDPTFRPLRPNQSS